MNTIAFPTVDSQTWAAFSQKGIEDVEKILFLVYTLKGASSFGFFCSSDFNIIL